MLGIILWGLVIYLIVRYVKKKKEESTKAEKDILSHQKLNLDNDYFLIKNGCLLEYRGQLDSIVVPRGVSQIGIEDINICKKTIHTIYIPNTVYVIADFALPYVESVHYEGPQELLHYDKQYNFFADGWIPDWSKLDPVHVHVNEVRFEYNFRHYDAIAKAHYERHPNELQPRM